MAKKRFSKSLFPILEICLKREFCMKEHSYNFQFSSVPGLCWSWRKFSFIGGFPHSIVFLSFKMKISLLTLKTTFEENLVRLQKKIMSFYYSLNILFFLFESLIYCISFSFIFIEFIRIYIYFKTSFIAADAFFGTFRNYFRFCGSIFCRYMFEICKCSGGLWQNRMT